MPEPSEGASRDGRRSRDPALDQPIVLSEPLITPALPSQGAVPTGEVVTTGYGKASNAGFPNERREVFLDVTCGGPAKASTGS